MFITSVNYFLKVKKTTLNSLLDLLTPSIARAIASIEFWVVFEICTQSLSWVLPEWNFLMQLIFANFCNLKDHTTRLLFVKFIY